MLSDKWIYASEMGRPLDQQPHLSHPNPRLTRLDEMLLKQPADSASHAVANAELAALSGRAEEAVSALGNIIGRFWRDLEANVALFARTCGAAIAASDFECAATLINRRYETDGWFGIGVEENSHRYPDVVRWEIRDKTSSVIWFDNGIPKSPTMESTIFRLASLLPLLSAYRNYDDFASGSLFLNLGDIGYVPGLAFCDNRPEYFLIPDAEFVLHRGYARMRPGGSAKVVPWSERQPIAFWRGGTTGQPRAAALGWRSLPRITLCEISQKHPDLLDAGISHVGQMPSAEIEREIRNSGLMRPFVPAVEFPKFKYHVDVDGNTNSWPGLFQKLLTGSPVLKVASPSGFRQWYYDRLRPWVNFVPVSADMSDLTEKIEWLRDHDHTARRLGENGQELALSLSYEVELRAAGRTITAAVRHFAGEPEMDFQFGLHLPKPVQLFEGWTAPRQDGLVASGRESRLDLPRPATSGAFVLELDLVPLTDLPVSPAQRVTVVANGDILHEAALLGPHRVHCRVSERNLATGTRLSLTLLHPDARSPASQSQPLDDRSLSFVLRRLTLTAESAYSRNNAMTTDTIPQGSAREGHGPEYGSLLHFPPGVRTGTLTTHWGTVVFADDRGTIVHGRPTISSGNIMAVSHEGRLYLLRNATSNERYATWISPEPLRGSERIPDARVPTGIQSFELAPGQREGSDFGLRYADLLLCAEPDGRITLSRKLLGPWERFKFAENPAQDRAVQGEASESKNLPEASATDKAAPSTVPDRRREEGISSEPCTVFKSWDGRRAWELAENGSLGELHQVLSDEFGNYCRIAIEVDEETPTPLARWEVIGPRESRLVVGRRAGRQQRGNLHLRAFDILPLIAAYHLAGAPVTGPVALSLEDWGLAPGLAFCDFRPDYFLIPDSFFVPTRSYEQTRRHYSNHPVPWSERAPVVFWRGHDFGPATSDWRSLPRAQLCALANQPPHRGLFDVGISLHRNALSFEEIKSSGLVRDVVPVQQFNRYRFHVDIDGRTNSWPGLFQKLLSGSSVLKVASAGGYRQWYYDRLCPWENFVPVAADLSDLVEKSEWLLHHDEEARAIGAAGQRLAESMTYASELHGAVQTIASAILAHCEPSHSRSPALTPADLSGTG